MGDKLILTPTLDVSTGITKVRRPMECVVVYVHPANLWYRVQFTSTSGATFCECFKIPD